MYVYGIPSTSRKIIVDLLLFYTKKLWENYKDQNKP